MAHAFHRLLLATEHSEHDAGAEALALAMARRCALPLGVVLPLLSNPEFEMVAPALAARADAEAARRRLGLQAAADAAGVTLDLAVRRGPELYELIVDEARQRRADLLVTRRRGRRGLLANLLVGEMVSAVVAHAPCSVLVTPRGAQLWQRGLVVGLDPAQAYAELLATAAQLALDCGVPLHLVCATEPGDTAAAAALLQAALAQARSAGAQASGELRPGRAHAVLLDVARERRADLLVVARHGATRLARAWVGGTAQKVIGLAECPVLVHVNAQQKDST